MNTWGYLILISALLIVAALMLYARFASRSREKSLHHAPAEFAAVEDEWENSLAENLEEAEEPVEVVTLEQEEENLSVKIEKRQEESNPVQKAEYFDELQEAAAGLAMLMRSSPVSDRATPVVFAPEEEELIAIEKIEISKQDSNEEELSGAIVDEAIVQETPTPETPSQETPSPEVETPDLSSPDLQENEPVGLDPSEKAVVLDEVATDTVVAEAAMEVVEPELSSADSNVVDTAEAAVESKEDEKTESIADLLGEEVNEQILRLDSGLDALEELVASIEVSLAELGPLQSELDSQEETESEAMAVEVAA